jgi:putative peptidoglycan lipid II flippase
LLPQGSASFIYYADRLNQLPLALVGTGVGVAILPAISRQIIGGDEKAAMHTQNRAVELSLLLALPAAAGLMLASTPLIAATLQSGHFTAEATHASASVLTAFACGLPAYILIKVFTPGFYARGDTKTPVRIALVEMACNMALNLFFVFCTNLAYVGLAISGASCAWINVALLYWMLHRRGHFTIDAQLRRRAIRLLLATIAMAALLLLLEPLVEPHITGGFVRKIAWLLALILPAAVGYFVAAFVFGAFRLPELKAMLLRRRLT